MPDGYNTIFRERGVRLSGIQKQRSFIAREFFRNTKLLILLEATIALDAGSEKCIKDSIECLKRKIIII